MTSFTTTFTYLVGISLPPFLASCSFCPPRSIPPRSIYPQLFIAIIGYASVGTLVTTRLGGKLVGLNFEQLQTEADFR